MLIEAVSFASVGKVQPFLVSIRSNACLVLDIHCHLKKEELYGYLAGTWDLNNHNVIITHTFPCLISKADTRPSVLVELEIQMEIEKLGLTLLGWYHSHPSNPAMPSLRDCDNQLDYQIKMRGPSEISYTPCVGIICSPYNPESPVLESSVTCFWVLPPPEQRPTEYPRPLLLQYNMLYDTHLSTHAMEQIKKSIKYYTQFSDDAYVKFQDNFKPDITYLDKLKCTLTPKFPKEQSDGLLWHFIKDELGCSSEQDDKMDLDALLAVPQPIPVSKSSSSTSISNLPSVSTLQQMVSRPAGVPPINVSSGIGSVSPHKFETPAQLNIPVPPSTSKSSKSTSSLPSTYPTGLDMLTSMALGLGSASSMPLSLGTTGLETLAANSMLAGLPSSMPTNLGASLSNTKIPDPPSYAASLQNLTSNISSYDKPSNSVSSSMPSPSTAIPASIASNLMMSSADIANALFSASKYSSAGILGIPDPMSKSTLAANNMFLSPSLLKMQESLLKPLSNSSPISSKAGLDPNTAMKSPHDILKSSKDYLSPEFSTSGIKRKLDTSLSLESPSRQNDSSSSKMETPKSDTIDTTVTDFSMTSSRSGSESFLNQMLELTKKTTMPDYLSDYNSSSLKLSKSEEYSVPLSSHSYSATSSIVDTIAQVAMGNFSKRDEPTDYSKEQDYSMPRSASESEQ
ncbi:MPN domain-containing protein CG4751 [Eumeta japonica]|uniref:MPN domain-containing protein CG4751 n=1 Tax=Eumeta variegata TaxID=151549 RepID=A0A4C1WCB0_EUMVA|nr:MPN domain-containing protein CG4751 [Eumeta japonica]